MSIEIRDNTKKNMADINNSELLSKNTQTEEPQLNLWDGITLPNQIVVKAKTNLVASNKIENRRYIGNKTKLLNWIGSIVEKETKDCDSF